MTPEDLGVASTFASSTLDHTDPATSSCNARPTSNSKNKISPTQEAGGAKRKKIWGFCCPSLANTSPVPPRGVPRGRGLFEEGLSREKGSSGS